MLVLSSLIVQIQGYVCFGILHAVLTGHRLASARCSGARIGSIVPITSGTGVKLAPSVLASGKVAYLRGDGARIEIVSADGKVGPSGTDIATNPAAWSPDGNHVVYSRTA